MALPKAAADKIAPGKPKGKLKGASDKPSNGNGPGGPSVPPGKPQPQPQLKAGASKKLKGMG